MDLNSLENIRLLRNCIAIEIRKIKAGENSESLEMQNKINNYSNLFHLLIKEDPKSVLQIQTGDLKKFSEYMLSTPPEEIFEKYINIVKQSMLESNTTYDEEKFNEFKDAMYSDFEGNKQEQMHPDQNTGENLTSTNIMNDLKKLFETHKSRSMSAAQFRDFSAQFKTLVRIFGKNKFQQYYEAFGQTVTDMQLSYDTTNHSKKAYQTTLTLSDKTGMTSRCTFNEPAPASLELAKPYQNLCYSYLEADKYSAIDTSLLDQTSIRKQMDTFTKCYKNLKEMAPLIIHIRDNKIIISGKSHCEVEKTPQEKTSTSDMTEKFAI